MEGNKVKKISENKKTSDYLTHISYRTSLLLLLAFTGFVIISIYFFITKPQETKIQLEPNHTYIKKFYTGFTNNLKVYVRPLSGQCTVDLLYGYDKSDEKVSQCKWTAKSNDTQTNSFVNDSLGSYYELRVTPTVKTKVLISVTMGNYMNVYHTPMNAEIAPINSANSRVIEMVNDGSSYSENQVSSIYDFGNTNAKNIEIFASCSNSTSPKLSLFGSDVNESDKFVRVTEISFTDGTFTSLNSKYYIDNVILTQHRYFYIQITDAAASDLYVKIVRRNY